MLDDQQDYQVLSGYQNETHTVIRAKRPWKTGDEDDFDIAKDTVRVIWATGASDQLSYHEKRRGTKSVLFRNWANPKGLNEADYKTWDIKVNNFEIPGDNDTLYYCQVFTIPEETRDVKHHIVGYESLIKSGNEAFVHHMVLYECIFPDEIEAQHVSLEMQKLAENGYGEECRTPNMPIHWHYCLTNTAFGWAVGGEGLALPQEAGLPIGGNKHTSYFILETHYDNPNLEKGVIDASGMRVFYTEELRPNDLGALSIGSMISPRQFIPPGRTEFRTIGMCGSHCTQKLGDDGVTLTAVLLHSHLLGRKLRLRHIRDGLELEAIAEDNAYDFNYQTSREVKGQILPGDDLIMECDYDSSQRVNYTIGGESTREEMCLAFLLYYPRRDVNFCVSGPTRETLFGALNIDVNATIAELESKKPIDVCGMKQNETQTRYTVKQLFKANEDKIRAMKFDDDLETKLNMGEHLLACGIRKTFGNVTKMSFPDFKPI